MALIKVVPEIIEEEAQRVLNKEISEEEVDEYLPIVKEYIPSATKPRT